MKEKFETYVPITVKCLLYIYFFSQLSKNILLQCGHRKNGRKFNYTVEKGYVIANKIFEKMEY